MYFAVLIPHHNMGNSFNWVCELELVSPSYPLFQKRILGSFRPYPNSNFNVLNSVGLTYLTKLPIQFMSLVLSQNGNNFDDSRQIYHGGEATETTSTTFTAHE